MTDPVTDTLLSGRGLDALTLRDWLVLRRVARLVGRLPLEEVADVEPDLYAAWLAAQVRWWHWGLGHMTLARVEAEMARRGIPGPDGRTQGPHDRGMRWLFEAHGRLERGEPVDDLFGPDGEPLIPGEGDPP